jgi:hypothetical protein
VNILNSDFIKGKTKEPKECGPEKFTKLVSKF